ncbi:MAG: Fe-S protein assembly chaperone HscA [Nannocystaceae bacterium]|nr:Fe-S protein assembly chaperone HscA [Nannocystaceae bacterium]
MRKTTVPGRGIGIDLGTTHSLVAVAPCGEAPRTLGDADGRALLPSVVSYIGETPDVGWDARAAQLSAPTRVVSSVKRFMGRGTADIEFQHPYRIAALGDGAADVVRLEVGQGRVVTPMEVSARILEVLAARAEEALGETPTGAVITVPAYFDEAQRQATKDAGRIAGLTVYRLLAEPTAAALAYGLDKGGQGLFAVYDLGGGTFDISVLRLRDGVFQVLATGGDSALGGDDFDRAVGEHLLREAGVHTPTVLQREQARVAARDAKETLSTAETVSVQWEGGPALTLTRGQLNAVIGPIAERTAAPCRGALKDAGVRARDLDGVVLVGGSTRTPLVRNLVESIFRRKPLSDIDPDQVVAYGAAIVADELSGYAREGATLLDVAPLSLGLETMGGIVEKIIPRNAAIPIAARQVFTNYSEKQTGMMIHVVQGERELADDCRSLARFDLSGIPRLPPSMARIEITFELDADALLTVTARELMTGVKQTVEVKPTYGLSDEDVDALVIESLDNADEDFARRNLAEARVELGRVVLAVSAALTEVGDVEGILVAEDRAAIVSALADGEAAMAPTGPTEHHEIVAVRERLEHVSEAFARRRMERALLAGMEGMSLSEVENTIAADDTLDAKRGSHEAEQIEKI